MVRFNDIDEKTTSAVAADEVLLIDSEDDGKTKRISATEFAGPTGDTGPAGIGYSTVGVGRDYETIALAQAADQLNLKCYGTLIHASGLTIGTNIYITSSCSLTIDTTSDIYGANIVGNGNFYLTDWNFYNSSFNGLDITINFEGGSGSMISYGNTITNCTFNNTNFISAQISGGNNNNTLTGNNFNLTPTSGYVYLQSMSYNKFDIDADADYIKVSNLDNCNIGIKGTTTSTNILEVVGTLSNSEVERDSLTDYTVDISNGGCRVIGNTFTGDLADSAQTCTIKGDGATDEFIFSNNFVGGTVELNTLNYGVYTGNLIYNQDADVSVSDVTNANNQTRY